MNDLIVVCDCGRGEYDIEEYSSCYDCFLDRRAAYIACIYCGRWHSPGFDTCFKCRPQGRDEAANDLKRVILARDGFRCAYCGITEGEDQLDQRLIRPKCPPTCLVVHNHRNPCRPSCSKKHKCRSRDDLGTCQPGCVQEHVHLIKDDDGMRAAALHIDHIQPCSKQGTADPWNLQALCGVCNVAKGGDWFAGSRHHARRRLVMAAYLTYLRDYLTADQRQDLAADAKLDRLTFARAIELVTSDYIIRVQACRPVRPVSSRLVTEDLPREYAHLDISAT